MNRGGMAAEENLRVSVATLNRVVFLHPENESLMLALERKAKVSHDGSVRVRAQPYGGAVRILDPTPLQTIIGQIQFDGERSDARRIFAF
jgi:hypothetical protein